MLNRDEFETFGFHNWNLAKELEMSDRLTRQQKKELGILPVQVMANLRHADVTKEMTSRELAFAYAAYASDEQEYGLAWTGVQQGTYGVDWDAIIAFLEKVMDLLIKFLPLFI
jgi:hypothetical protein